MKPFVSRLQVENFACIKSVDIALTRLHAFIGPNDSGKSTLLKALWRIGSAGSSQFPAPASIPSSTNYSITAFEDRSNWYRLERGKNPRTEGRVGFLRGAHFVSLEPDALRQPCKLIPHGDAVTLGSVQGHGLAAVLDVMLSRHAEQFLTLRATFAKLFTGIDRLEIQNAGNDQKRLGATLVDGTQIGPEAMSEGMLYWLAFKALQYATKPSILLVEEPETGLHPSRISEIVTLLRDISQETQVVMATHSPLVINEMQPEEVTIVTRTAERGTIATPMRETKHFEQRRSIYALGELWLSYADGVLESDLVPESAKDTKAAG